MWILWFQLYVYEVNWTNAPKGLLKSRHQAEKGDRKEPWRDESLALCTGIQNIQTTYVKWNIASHSETSAALSYTTSSPVRSVHVHGLFVDPKVRGTYSTQCKTIICFRAPLNIESVPGLLLCDSAAGTSPGNPTCCVFLTCEDFIASPSLCCPRQARTGTAALPVLICIPLVLQSSSLSQLFSFFSSMNKHLQAHTYCQAVLRVITLLCRFTCGSPDSPNVSAWVCRMFRHVPILRCKFTLT